MSIESTVVSAVEGVAGTAVSAVIPNPVNYIKWTAYALGAATALFLAYKVIAFVDQANSDHAAVGVLTTQLASAAKINADNIVTMAAAETQHLAAVTGALAAKSEALTKSADLNTALEALRHAPHTSTPACAPTGPAADVINRLRH